ncbi:hypothetical protein [Schlesneria paludicola]|uniref:hypothetical protein n=1 Tax=Schlesneria paludicola TaxID=360056 RepID=UPI00029AABD7|nr:hypothetical protein [Schlesneria paludicola]
MWKTILFFVAAFALVSIRGHAEGPRDVPEVSTHEVARRGNHVEETGTVRSGLRAAALAPPADDSGKWFITLIVRPGERSSEIMRQTVERDPDMRHWVNAGNPATSTTHYHVRSIADQTQRDWLESVIPAVNKAGVPAIVLQPPLSGQFGPPKTIVKIIHGQLTGRDLADKLREAVLNYVDKLESVNQVGVKHAVGVAPPFNVQPVQPQPQFAPAPPFNAQPFNVQPEANLPFEWPPAKPKTLTIEQIQAACPGATPEFILPIVTGPGETSMDIVRMKWLMYQKEHPPAAIDPPSVCAPPECVVPVNPTNPANGMLSAVSLDRLGLMVALVLMGIMAGIFIPRLLAGRTGATGAGLEMMTAQLLHPTQGQVMTTPQSVNYAPQSSGRDWRAPASSGNAPTPNG